MMWLKRLRLWLCKKMAEHKYAGYDPDICCCGSVVPDNGYCTFPGMCRSQVEYTITTIVERKRKELGM